MGARVAVGRRRTASWLSRAEEAPPGPVPCGLVEVRSELLVLLYGRTLREVLEACSASACGQRLGPSQSAFGASPLASGAEAIAGASSLIHWAGTGSRREPLEVS